MKKSFEQQMEETLSYLQRERDLWLHYKRRDERAEGWDGEAKRLRQESIDRLDTDLVTYFGQITMLGAMRNE